MNNRAKAPKKWANDLTIVLNALGDEERFPVKIKQLALDYTRSVFPDDPIIFIEGESLPGFEGGLFKRSGGWGILYNSDITSSGRINFTLAHEFGHYLLHRQDYPDGIRCSAEDMMQWGSEGRKVEQQANDFAATLLMPLDDYRQQIDGFTQPTLKDIGACANRYDVSLMAAILRWLEYTQKRAILVKSRDGFICWAKSSQPALRTGTYFKTVNRPPIEIPIIKMHAKLLNEGGGEETIEHDANVWLKEPCVEHVLVSNHYDFVLSLLHLEDVESQHEEIEEPEEDTLDQMII